MRSTAPVVRLAAAADVPAVTAIAQAAYSIYVPRIGRPPMPMVADYADLAARGLLRVLEVEGLIAGFLVLIPEPDALLLDNIAVSPDFQKQGFGRRLLEVADAVARAAGHRSIHLYTNAAMTENIALYGRYGYAETHRATEHGLDRVYMRKLL